MKLDYHYFNQSTLNSVQKVLKSGKVNYWTGNECKKFEREFSKYIENKYSITLCNGSVALEIALKALNLKKKRQDYCFSKIIYNLSKLCFKFGVETCICWCRW